MRPSRRVARVAALFDSRAVRRSTPKPASTASASIVRMMNRDGMRMKLRPGSQCTYSHNSTGQPMNINVDTTASNR